MIISDTHKFIFHHVPKTGGSSITAAIAPYCKNYQGVMPLDETHGWQFVFHQPYYMHHAVRLLEPGDIPEGYFSFAFVRNPFAAVVSAWDSKMNFDEFVEEKIFTALEPVARWTQFDYLTDEKDGTMLVDFIGRYEKLAEDFYKVITMIGLPLMMLPKRNITKNKLHDNYREYYSPVSRRIVEEKYKKDLEFFEYEF